MVFMSDNRLNVVNIQNKSLQGSWKEKANSWRHETKTYFEKMWSIDPEQFNPMLNCMEPRRIKRTWHLVNKLIDPKDKLAADLGCGSGILTKYLKEANAQVHSLDIAARALNICDKMHPMSMQLMNNVYHTQHLKMIFMI